ncbi:MAG: hypothetical protein JHD16_06970, partial [Solirubrobacteraceae bacterium]|nr:hypothetical protein [Solirubrobacteraceae bacterium]
ATFSYTLRRPGGSTWTTTAYASFAPVFQAIGRTHDVALIPMVYFKASPTRFTRLFVDDDRTLLQSEDGLYGLSPTPPTTRYTVATPYALDATQPKTAGTKLTFTANEPIDTADRVARASWISCDTNPDEVAPVGAFSDYIEITRAPVRSTSSLGSVLFNGGRAGVRTPSKVTIEAKVFGITIWKRTPTTYANITLPRPPLWLPVTVTATVQPSAANGVTPAPLTQSFSAFATR